MGGKRERLADLLFKTRLIEILSRFTVHNINVKLKQSVLYPDYSDYSGLSLISFSISSRSYTGEIRVSLRICRSSPP